MNASTLFSHTTLVGWVDGPETRGTFQLLSSCLFTIVSCTWSVLHLNVPAAGESAVTRFSRKLKWTLTTILAPEYVLQLGYLGWLDAEQLMTHLRKLESDGELEGIMEEIEVTDTSSKPAQCLTIEPKPPNLLSSFLSRFHRARVTKDVPLEEEALNVERQEVPVVKEDHVIELDQMNHPPSNLSPSADNAAFLDQHTPQRRRVFTLAHAYLASLGSLRLELQRRGEPPHGETRAQWNACIPFLTPSSFRDVVYRYPYSPLRYIDITDVEIKDKSNSDIFTKLIAVGQILSLALSVVSRWVRHIAVSQLELVTLSFAVMATLICLVNLDKPQNIEVASVVKMSKFATDPEEDRHIRLAMVHTFDKDYSNPAKDEELMEVAKRTRLGTAAGSPIIYHGWLPILIPIVVSSVVFGALHCIAWNYDFPGSAERLLWRIAGVASTVLPLAILQEPRQDLPGRPSNGPLIYALLLLLLLYAIARLILIVITFTSLRQMPADTYLSTWAQYIPTIN